MAGENKGSNSEIELRIQTTFEMIIKGCTKDFICRYMSQKHNVGERQSERYMAEAHQKIKDANTPEEQKKLIDIAIAQYNDLYSKNYTIQDFRECRNVIDSRAKMLGHYEKDNDQSKSVTNIINLGIGENPKEDAITD